MLKLMLLVSKQHMNITALASGGHKTKLRKTEASLRVSFYQMSSREEPYAPCLAQGRD